LDAWAKDDIDSKTNPHSRRYKFSISSLDEEVSSPKLQASPSGVRRGPLGLTYGVSIDVSEPHAPEAESASGKIVFEELSSRLPMIVHQTCMAMNESIATIRDRHLVDASFLSDSTNHGALAQIVFELSSSSYYFAKWCHELQPISYSQPIKPSHSMECEAADLLSQLQSGVSRMQMYASKFCPMLDQVMRAQKYNFTVTGENALDIAQRHGLSTSEVSGIAAHLEHLLSDTRRLVGACATVKHGRPSTAPAARVRSRATAPADMASTAPAGRVRSRAVAPGDI